MSATAASTAAAAAASGKIGRPRKAVVSQFMQLAPAPELVPVPPAQRQFAATIKLPAPLMRALLAGHKASMRFGDKDNDVSFVIDGVSFPLRCGKEDPHKQDVLESTVYADAATADSDATMADAAAASAVTPSAGTAATPASPSLSAATVPLFAPYSNVLRPLPHVHVENRFYIQRQLDEDDKRVMQERTKLSEQEAKQQRVKHTTLAESSSLLQASSAAVAADATATKGKRKAAAVSDVAEPKAKRKYTKKLPQPLTPAQSSAMLSPRTPVATPPSSQQQQQEQQLQQPSPSVVMSPASAAPSHEEKTGAAAGGGSAAAPSSLSKPRLLRSPSAVALPSSSTSGEKLLARVAHFLAAQVHGLGSATLVSRLSVSLAELKATLAAVARYEAPGFYRLKPEVYAELRLEDWPDYNDEDRQRVVDKMMRAELPVPEAWRRFASKDAPKIAPMNEPTLPVLPDLTQLPDALPAHMLISASIPAASESTDSSSATTATAEAASAASLAPPRTITSYTEYLELHTEFLHKFRAYRQCGTWLTALSEATASLRSQAGATIDPVVREAREKQTVAYAQRYEATAALCRQKQAVLHLYLATLKPSIVSYADAHGLFVPPSVQHAAH